MTSLLHEDRQFLDTETIEQLLTGMQRIKNTLFEKLYIDSSLSNVLAGPNSVCIKL